MNAAISLEELQLATRNHGMPLEALRYDITPVGLHYLLIHYDIPPEDEDVEAVFTGADRGIEGGEEQFFQRSLPLAEALEADAVVAYEVNGMPLPPQHGFPLRLLVPGWYGMTNVKWLTEIELVDRPFDGYQMTTAYLFRRDGE